MEWLAVDKMIWVGDALQTERLNSSNNDDEISVELIETHYTIVVHFGNPLSLLEGYIDLLYESHEVHTQLSFFFRRL